MILLMFQGAVRPSFPPSPLDCFRLVCSLLFIFVRLLTVAVDVHPATFVPMLWSFQAAFSVTPFPLYFLLFSSFFLLFTFNLFFFSSRQSLPTTITHHFFISKTWKRPSLSLDESPLHPRQSPKQQLPPHHPFPLSQVQLQSIPISKSLLTQTQAPFLKGLMARVIPTYHPTLSPRPPCKRLSLPLTRQYPFPPRIRPLLLCTLPPMATAMSQEQCPQG